MATAIAADRGTRQPRVEHDSLGPVEVPADKLWGAQTQRSLEHFSIGDDLIPREMIPAYAIVKKGAALVNHRAGRLGQPQRDLIARVCEVSCRRGTTGIAARNSCAAKVT